MYPPSLLGGFSHEDSADFGPQYDMSMPANHANNLAQGDLIV
jgi:hypothetical protein